jgi:predicted small secreted protein
MIIMETIMRNLSLALTLFALVAATPLLSACQTTAGFGHDISNGGHALTNSAEKNAPPGDRR